MIINIIIIIITLYILHIIIAVYILHVIITYIKQDIAYPGY